MIRHAALTDDGKRRDHNEDAYLALPDDGVFLVADGVGGRACGEVAAAMTVETFETSTGVLKEALQAYSAGPSRGTRNKVLEVLGQTCQNASRAVYEAAEAEARRGMTTTLVAAVVGHGAIFLAHVGDSRAYLLREGELLQLTDDHSMVNELVRTGQMSYDEAKRSRYRNVITRAIGLQPGVQPDVAAVEVLPGDRLMLCSDGLSDPVPAADICRLMADGSPAQATSRLLQQALDNGGPDNVTVVVIDPDASPQAEAAAARAEVMAGLFLFADLPFHARARVGRMVSDVFVQPGDTLVTQGDQGRSMYVVVQGKVEVVLDGVALARMGPGEHFGELALVDARPRSATVKAIGAATLIQIDRNALDDFCRREPELGTRILWKLLGTVTGRLRNASTRIADLENT
ncbi:MAG: cyclic nucleotide-binding domain-containing protein [Proteobacteria bacterium]|nr:cyclic nucleotide-binding domain-containing protein [Pseudomonadota bacterium]MCP4915572.1 cyclic nucleotide-binding domain-containing protein [Pseudomonadota bacterium]